MTAGHTAAMLDTSVWVRVFEGDDAFARDLGRVQGALPTITSPIVLAEIASILSRGRITSAEPLDAVLAGALVEELTVQDAIRAGELHGALRAAGHEKAALGDCLIYATSERVGALLITCDRDLAKQQNVALLSNAPAGRRSK